jgi:hypothetical protein
MTFNAEAANMTPESMAILNDLPESIHVFVETPGVQDDHVEEPQVYWSTDPFVNTTEAIPPGALTIRMRWSTEVEVAWWEPRHYEVAEAVLRRHGVDPTTNSAAQSLNLPLLEMCSDQRQDGESTVR